MDYTKQPLDYPQILRMLKDRGLIVKDEIEALRQLIIIKQVTSTAVTNDEYSPVNYTRIRLTFIPSELA